MMTTIMTTITGSTTSENQFEAWACLDRELNEVEEEGLLGEEEDLGGAPQRLFSLATMVMLPYFLEKSQIGVINDPLGLTHIRLVTNIVFT